MIDVKELKFAYGTVPSQKEPVYTLDGVSLEIKKGEIFGILGPNGSGKTTLLKNIQLFLKPAMGEITYFGQSHRELSARRISRMLSLVPQKSGGGMSLTVEEMIRLGRIPHMKNPWEGYSSEDKQVVDEVISRLGLEPFKSRQCHSLSGGEFQKVLLARALAQKSRILLLDEATANLDMRHCVEIMELVQQRAREGCTVVSVLHDLNLAAEFCHRMVLMKKGRVCYRGTPVELFKREVIKEIYDIDARVGYDEAGVPFVLPRAVKQGVVA